MNKFRIDVDSEDMLIEREPQSVWGEYWERKVGLIDESTEGFQTMLEDMGKPRELKKLEEYVCQTFQHLL